MDIQYKIVSKSIFAEREPIRILIIQKFWKSEKCHNKNATVSLFDVSTMNARVLYISKYHFDYTISELFLKYIQ